MITQGHIDALDVAFEEGELEVSIHDDSVVPDVERDPDDVLLVALPGSRLTVPEDPAFGFLGDAGDPVWVLPEVQDPALLWPGIATEEVDAGVFRGDALAVRLVFEVSGRLADAGTRVSSGRVALAFEVRS